MSRRTAFGVLASAAALTALAVGSEGSAATKVPPPPPMPPASDFVTTIDNKYFPLQPGTTFRYWGTEDDLPAVDKVVVTTMTKTILGVQATVVLDRVTVNGEPAEKTSTGTPRTRAATSGTWAKTPSST